MTLDPKKRLGIVQGGKCGARMHLRAPRLCPSSVPRGFTLSRTQTHLCPELALSPCIFRDVSRLRNISQSPTGPEGQDSASQPAPARVSGGSPGQGAGSTVRPFGTTTFPNGTGPLSSAPARSCPLALGDSCPLCRVQILLCSATTGHLQATLNTEVDTEGEGTCFFFSNHLRLK